MQPISLSTGVSNIRSVFERSSPSAYNKGTAWYTEASRFCWLTARKYMFTYEGVVGALAALSPMLEWESNKLAVLDLIENGRPRQVWVGRNVDKAQRCLDGSYPLDVLGGPKVRAFYSAVLEPAAGHNEAVIDRHAASVYVGRRLTDRELHNLGVRFVRSAQLAYRAAAEQIGLLPVELQAVAWVQWRTEVQDVSAGGPQVAG